MQFETEEESKQNRNQIKRQSRPRPPAPSSGQLLRTYYVMFAVYAAAFLAVAVITRGESVRNVLFYNAISGEDDYFMDYFNSIRNSIFEFSYNIGVIYPPLVNLFYFFLSRLLPAGTTDNIDFPGRYIVRNGQLPLLSYVLFTVAVVLFTVKVIEKYVARSSLPRSKALLAYTIVFSYPSVYCIERGNITMLAAVLTLVFVMYRDSEKRYLRELSFIALAVAASIKIYPAVFGLLLIFDKKYKDAARLAVYGAVLFIVPFFFYDGFTSIYQFVKKILDFSDKKAVFFGVGQVSVKNIAALLGLVFDFTGDTVRRVGGTLFPLTQFLALFAAATVPLKWQKAAALTYFMINFAAVSQAYSVLFLVVPFLMLLSGGEPLRRIDRVYLVVFALFFVPLPPFSSLSDLFGVGGLGGLITYQNREVFKNIFTQPNQYLSMLLMQLLLLLLTVEGVSKTIKTLKKRDSAPVIVNI